MVRWLMNLALQGLNGLLTIKHYHGRQTNCIFLQSFFNRPSEVHLAIARSGPIYLSHRSIPGEFYFPPNMRGQLPTDGSGCVGIFPQIHRLQHRSAEVLGIMKRPQS